MDRKEMPPTLGNEETYVVTISRQFGSLGRPIAKKLAQKLQINYYDRYIVEKAAMQLESDETEVKELEESAEISGRRFFADMAYPFKTGTTEMQDAIFEKEKEIILGLAERESCVIVGRCSDYILRNYKNHISIYIYAPYYERMKNSVDALGLMPDEAERVIDEVDEAREAFNQHYAGCAADEIRMKDILIDSSVLGVEQTADFLADFVRKAFDLGAGSCR